jgi:hypothetical protein
VTEFIRHARACETCREVTSQVITDIVGDMPVDELMKKLEERTAALCLVGIRLFHTYV